MKVVFVRHSDSRPIDVHDFDIINSLLDRLRSICPDQNVRLVVSKTPDLPLESANLIAQALSQPIYYVDSLFLDGIDLPEISRLNTPKVEGLVRRYAQDVDVLILVGWVVTRLSADRAIDRCRNKEEFEFCAYTQVHSFTTELLIINFP